MPGRYREAALSARLVSQIGDFALVLGLVCSAHLLLLCAWSRALSARQHWRSGGLLRVSDEEAFKEADEDDDDDDEPTRAQRASRVAARCGRRLANLGAFALCGRAPAHEPSLALRRRGGRLVATVVRPVEADDAAAGEEGGGEAAAAGAAEASELAACKGCCCPRVPALLYWPNAEVVVVMCDYAAGASNALTLCTRRKGRRPHACVHAARARAPAHGARRRYYAAGLSRSACLGTYAHLAGTLDAPPTLGICVAGGAFLAGFMAREGRRLRAFRRQRHAERLWQPSRAISRRSEMDDPLLRALHCLRLQPRQPALRLRGRFVLPAPLARSWSSRWSADATPPPSQPPSARKGALVPPPPPPPSCALRA